MLNIQTHGLYLSYMNHFPPIIALILSQVPSPYWVIILIIINEALYHGMPRNVPIHQSI